jgi:LysM repeat protein
MSDFRQGLLGLFFALLTGFMILGGAVLSLVESDYLGELSGTATYLAAWDMSAIQPYTPNPGAPTFTAVPVGRETLTATPTFGPVAGCPIPPGWSAVMTQLGDTLTSVAQIYQLSAAQLAQANCLASDSLDLAPGIFLFVPQPTATLPPMLQTATAAVATPTRYVCGVPSGWVSYRVRSGDTLFTLSQLTGVSVFQIQRANCMGNSSLIVSGQSLFLPFIPVFPTRIPTFTAIPTLIPTATAMAPTATVIVSTATVIAPTATFTQQPPTTTLTVTPLTPTTSPTGAFPQPTDTQTLAPVTPSATPIPPSATPVSPTATSILPSLSPTPLNTIISPLFASKSPTFPDGK